MKRSVDRRLWAPQWACLGLALLLASCAAPGPKAEDDDQGTLVVNEGDAAEQTPEQRYAAALELMRSNQNDEAQAQLEALAEEVPDRSGPLTNLGILHARAKRWTESRKALQQAVKINPQNAVAWNELGRAERQLDNATAARDAFRQAIDRDPQLAAAHLNLGLVLDNPLGDATGAIDHYRQYLALNGGDDLRVLVWIAELERTLAADPASADEE